MALRFLEPAGIRLTQNCRAARNLASSSPRAFRILALEGQPHSGAPVRWRRGGQEGVGAVRARMKGLAGQIHEAGRRRKLNIHPVDKQRLRGDAPSRRSITEWEVRCEEKGEL